MSSRPKLKSRGNQFEEPLIAFQISWTEDVEIAIVELFVVLIIKLAQRPMRVLT